MKKTLLLLLLTVSVILCACGEVQSTESQQIESVVGDSSAESGVSAETETESEDESSTPSDTESETESDSESETESDTESETVSDTESETVSDTESEDEEDVLVESIEVNADRNMLYIGESLQIQAVVLPENAANKDVVFSILTGSEIATITEDGLLQANAPGSVVIKVESTDGSEVSAEWTVEIWQLPAVLINSIKLSAKKSELTVGDTLEISAEVLPADADTHSILWSVASGSECATISQDGVLTARKEGTVTVRATALDGSDVYGEIKLTIKPAPVTEIKVSSVEIKGAKDISVGDTLTLTATVLPENATNRKVTWAITSGSSYASITQDGKLTANKSGQVKITATAQDGSGKSATVTVNIKDKSLWDGAGTKSDPYLIRNLNDLMNLQKVVNKKGYYFKQVANIDCASVSEWVVIGDNDTPFRHHYNGGGYTISNLCLNGDAIALISEAMDANFQNIKIVNAYTTKDDNEIAALVGWATGCTFADCSAQVNFHASNNDSAGLVCCVTLKEGQGDLMVNCNVQGTIYSSGNMGGLIGSIFRSFEGEDFAPEATPDIYVKNCYSDVDLFSIAGSLEHEYIGGLIAFANLVKIDKCYATGDIEAIRGNIGGLVGYSMYATDITRCYATGDIYASTDNHYGGVSIGGLVGQMLGNVMVHDCYATGDISAPYVEWSPCQDDSPKNGGPHLMYYNPCGSLIGSVKTAGNYRDNTKLRIYNNYATGKVNVPNICEDERVYCHGALVGLVYDNYTYRYITDKTKKDQSDWAGFSDTCIFKFESNYNLEALRTYYTPFNEYAGSNLLGMQNPKYTAMPQHEYVEIITEQQLSQQATFEGWDFQNIWKMTADGPVLR